jgi:hypothetical protein
VYTSELVEILDAQGNVKKFCNQLYNHLQSMKCYHWQKLLEQNTWISDVVGETDTFNYNQRNATLRKEWSQTTEIRCGKSCIYGGTT